MHWNLQKKSISTVIQILARYKKTLTLITFFIQDSADKHIPSKITVFSVSWVTLEIRRKIRRRNKTHAKAKKTDSKKLRSKFETLRRQIKDDVRKQHDLYVIDVLVTWSATLRQILETFIGTSIVRKKTINVFRPLKEEEELVSQLQKLNRLKILMVSLRMCSTKAIIVRSHFSVCRPLSWTTLLFQMRV